MKALPLHIARRYLLSRKLPTAVNLITWVSIVGITLVTAVLIIVMSVFNGFNLLLGELYQSFDPDLKIVPASGKYVALDEATRNKLEAIEGVAVVGVSLEARAVLKNQERQQLVTLKGVDEAFRQTSDITQIIDIGEYDLRTLRGAHGAVLGAGVAGRLGVYSGIELPRLTLFSLSATKDVLTMGEAAINYAEVDPSGRFVIQKDYDDELVILRLSVVQKLMDLSGQISSYDLETQPDAQLDRIQSEAEAIVGGDFRVLDDKGQHPTHFKLMRNEKAVGFLMLGFMLLLVSVNVIGALTMIVTEKRQDFGMLRSMGATESLIRRTVLTNGLLVGLIGGGLGVLLGAGLTLLQQEFGLLKLKGGENFIIDHFPVQLHFADLLLAFALVLMIASVAGLYPAARAVRLSITEQLRHG